jgi:hypothetical protein
LDSWSDNNLTLKYYSRDFMRKGSRAITDYGQVLERSGFLPGYGYRTRSSLFELQVVAARIFEKATCVEFWHSNQPGSGLSVESEPAGALNPSSDYSHEGRKIQ